MSRALILLAWVCMMGPVCAQESVPPPGPSEKLPEEDAKNYQIRQTGNNLELVTPYGNRMLFGDPGLTHANEYRLEIPLDELRPPKPPAPPAREIAAETQKPEPVVEPVKEVQKTLVEYDQTDRLILEANRLYNRGKFYEASLTVEELIAHRPDLPRAWVMKGSLMYVQGHKDLAKSAWEKAIELDPANSAVRSFLRRVQ